MTDKRTFFEKSLLFLIVLLFILPSFSSAQLKILKKFVLNVTLDLDGPARTDCVDPPVYIYESFENDKLIIPAEVFFEVFSMEGKRIAKAGGRGEGPGDFRFIIWMDKYKNNYCFLDFPNRINFYDNNFNFTNRVHFQGSILAQHVYSFAFFQDKVLMGQRRLGESRKNEKCISVYDPNGKFRDAFFDKGIGWEIYPDNSLLQPVVLSLGDHIYFAFNAIPAIWKLDGNGGILKKVTIGKSWWKKIIYNAGEYRRKKRKFGWKAVSELVLSGDLIQKLWKWKGNVIAQIVRDGCADPRNLFMVISKDFRKQSPLITYKDYQFSGAGKHIYLARLLDIDRKNRKKTVEVLQCDYAF